MAQRLFNVSAHWDSEAQVYYSESDIVGLHIEAPDLDIFESVLMEVAPGLIVANHMSPEALETGKPEELIPAILWRRPEGRAA
ncbi:DUF1902 domain-containing protein [Devosia sp. YIM 151766]|uniref:DUF1902 domain-containing protein n=1 Tax=Devosia sp. YIM 151766 TaxID=3017325 RepID=UPI00255D0383|nr:DUF1902 domain-containing protein [Devosia sp. YIM 151766]WIY53679.1 DUF1902 domain-containing protein [Devosia sp. YIM 151766]